MEKEANKKFYEIKVKWCYEKNNKPLLATYEMRAIVKCENNKCIGTSTITINNSLDIWDIEGIIAGAFFDENRFNFYNLDFSKTLGNKQFIKGLNTTSEIHIQPTLRNDDRYKCNVLQSQIKEIDLACGEQYSFKNELEDYKLKAYFEFKRGEKILEHLLSDSFIETSKKLVSNKIKNAVI